jgi:hypothetical protein
MADDAKSTQQVVRHGLRAQGIIPILTRFTIEGGPGPFAVDRPLDVEGGFTIAHDADDDGNVRRILLDMEVDIFGQKGRTNLPPPEDAGARTFAGRVCAEHVFTRPFAPPGERKVLALEIGDLRIPPGPRRAWCAPGTTIEPPPSARALESGFAEDAVTVVMGAGHTDSNQHVNSLVYPRLFEEAALRRMVALGRPATVLSRALDIAFRRPTFAGEKLRIALRAFEDGQRVVCVGAFFGENESDLGRARAYVQMAFE